MPSPHPAGLTITNPLTLYRTLVATKKLKPDPAQHRLALHLQKLYYRLKDYAPEVEYRQRLDHISRAIGEVPRRVEDGQRLPRSSFLSSLWRQDGIRDGSMLSLTRTVPVHESAMTIDSPQGMMLYGEVGRGKSMLLDLLADCLPSQKKRRWHFNAFMLDTFRKLEQLRKERMDMSPSLKGLDQEHSVLTMARDMVSTSPILFLDEFQFPDRAASKLLSSFLTSFFHLGGVLIATSNRMPEELAKAAGVEFMPPPRSPFDSVSSFLKYGRKSAPAELAASTDFGAFLEVLKARCEIWEMEGEKDWRREYRASAVGHDDGGSIENDLSDVTVEPVVSSGTEDSDAMAGPREQTVPTFYHLTPVSSALETLQEAETAWLKATNQAVSPAAGVTGDTPEWSSAIMRVYGRQVTVPAQYQGSTKWKFSELCGSTLGPADYITLASTYHTLVLENVPLLTTSLKNEARRFITLLDALYEARCKLIVRAAVLPDHLFFPEVRNTGNLENMSTKPSSDSDEVYQETLAEIYQDATNPFRPNVSIYHEDSSGTPSLLNQTRRSVLADEDADFGPVYGNGRGHGASSGDHGLAETQRRQNGPDFTRTTILTGEDEKFAYKRARSRLWELCSERWWTDRQGPPGQWWKPMTRSLRHWEGNDLEDQQSTNLTPLTTPESDSTQPSSPPSPSPPPEEIEDAETPTTSSSPYRTDPSPPPQFSWVHAWGMMQWGKKAGEWGKGVEGKKRSK